MKQKDKIVIEVDNDFKIVIDSFNWVVVQSRKSKGNIANDGKGEGKMIEVVESYNHNLEGALLSIMRLKAQNSTESKTIEAYLSEYREILHSMTETVLSKEIELKAALSLNEAI